MPALRPVRIDRFLPVKVLIVKLSSLGDVVHAMPAVQDIRRAFPHAQIDWVVEPGFAPLVSRCEGVRRVIACNLRAWRKNLFSAATRQAWGRFKTELQAEQYDAVIDLQGLTKSALVAWLAQLSPQGRRYALANRTDGSSYEAPTRWVADVAVPVFPHSSAVQRGRALCAQALGYAVPIGSPQDDPSYGLLAKFPQAHPAINSIVFDTPYRVVVALVHGTSRADKLWPEAHWVALAQRLMREGYSIALLHGNDEEEVRSHRIRTALNDHRVHIWPRLRLDVLTDQLARTAGVIGVDSGLSHIAVALNLPHVQLYNFDTAWRTGPHAPRQCSVFASPCPSVDAVWQAWQAVLVFPNSP
jgi:heptosyltransferase-1